MKLPIAQLKEGENPFHFESSRDSWLRDVMARVKKEGVKVQGPVDVKVNITKLEPDYYVRGKMLFQAEQACARCAESVPFEVNHPFELAMAHVPGGKHVDPKLSEESEELDVNYFVGNDIDLEPVVEEQVFLSLPYRTLCQEECRGICQRCGKNLNAGPCGCKMEDESKPFSALGKLKL